MKVQMKTRSRQKPFLPPTYLLVALVLVSVLHLVFPQPKLIQSPWNILGIIPMGIGVVINVLADKQFHKANTTVNPFEKASTLVTDGLFRFSRNPMYLGFVLVLLGEWVLLGSLIPLIIIPLFTTLIHFRFILVEERTLAKTFGEDWVNYCKKVRRWI